MVNRTMGIKVVVSLGVIGSLFIGVLSSGQQARTKKQNMVEMGEQFTALNRKMIAGAVTAKLTDQDFQEIETYSEALARLANEYAQLESDKDLAAISTNLATNASYLKQQVAGKDALVTVMSSGQLLSFCAECHYQARWKVSASRP